MIDYTRRADRWTHEEIADALEEIGFDDFACELREFLENDDFVADWIADDWESGVLDGVISASWICEWVDEFEDDYFDPDDERCVHLRRVLRYFRKKYWDT
jgi:hypothetical protein